MWQCWRAANTGSLGGICVSFCHTPREMLSGRDLPLSEVTRSNYVPLLDPYVHATGPVRRQRRQRIDVNLLRRSEKRSV